ncbi:MAG: ATP-binding protein [Desulfosoma sp.]
MGDHENTGVERLFREIFEHASTGIAVYEAVDDGEDFIFKDINPAGARIGRLPREAHLGRRVTEVYPGVRDLGLLKVFREVYRTGVPQRLPISMYQDSRIALWVENYVCKLPSGEILAVYEDETARKRAEHEKLELLKQLHRAQRMESLAALAAGIAHDFNNILMPILGYAQMGVERCRPGDPSARIFQRILDAGRRAKNLAGQILLLSRDDSSPPAVVDTVPILKECAKLLRAGVPKTIEIAYEGLPEAAPVRADPVEIHQVIMNLSVNAFHAVGKDKGTIRFRLACPCRDAEILRKAPEASKSWVHLSVADTGPGVPADLRERIFDPYFTTKGPDQGTGLGLFIVSGIVNRLGGSVWVGDNPQGGAVFHVLLPAASEPALPEAASEPVAEKKFQAHVVAVDDDSDVLRILETFLSPHVDRLTLFSDPSKALNACQSPSSAPDLLLTDLSMPGMSGTELAHSVKALRPDLPIVMLTGYTDPSGGPCMDSTVIDKILYKPVMKSELMRVLQDCLEGRGADDRANSGGR